MEKNRRAWWASLEFEKLQHSNKKDYRQVRELFNRGDNYLLGLNDNCVITRRIFSRQNHEIFDLLHLLRLIHNWKKVKLFINGVAIHKTQMFYVMKQCECFLYKKPCHNKSLTFKWMYLGCHLAKERIGFFNYYFSNAYWFWFSFYKEDKKHKKFVLDIAQILDITNQFAFCPARQADITSILKGLPSSITYKSMTENSMWEESKKIISKRLIKFFPAIVPRNPEVYNTWIQQFVE